MLDEHDRRGTRGPDLGESREECGCRLASGSRSAAGSGRAEQMGAAAREHPASAEERRCRSPPTGFANAAARKPPSLTAASAFGYAPASPVAPAAVFQPNADVVPDAIHDHLGRGILEDEPDPRGEGAGLERGRLEAIDGQGTGRRPRISRGSDRPPPAQRCSCPTPTGRPRAGNRPARARRPHPGARAQPIRIGEPELAGPDAPGDDVTAGENGGLGQSGNPSSTPARRSARTSAIDAAGRRIRPETVIATAMTTRTSVA